MLIRSLLLTPILAQLAAAQVPLLTGSGGKAVVTGVVQDSISRTPLAGALVQLAAADDPSRFGRTVPSDSLGRYSLEDIPAGRYTIGFFHPLLDSLGIEPTLREVRIDGVNPVRVDLSTPSTTRLRKAICGAQSRTGAVILGVVRDAGDGSPIPGVAVTGQWLEYSFRRDGLVRRIPRLTATTGENGWFAICNVPSDGIVSLMASRGADSTDVLDVHVANDGFLRRELYLGQSRPVAIDEVASALPDAVAVARQPIRSGDGRLSGRVVAAIDGRAVAGALVSLVNGPQTTANADGEWSLADAPRGTRMLEVRAVGFYPERRAVDVFSDAPPVKVALSTLRAVLDTVKIRAKRLSLDRTGFSERRRTGAGRYLTVTDIARRPAITASDIFRSMPGIKIGFASDTMETDMTPIGDVESSFPVDRKLLMRGISGNWCAPDLYLDGLRIPALGADDLDGWISPSNIAGIEIYFEAAVPAEYRQGRTGCGVILIWGKDSG
ncbi:MAG: TonB-dependent receptor [Gemmatimonadaceae bacterium]